MCYGSVVPTHSHVKHNASNPDTTLKVHNKIKKINEMKNKKKTADYH